MTRAPFLVGLAAVLASACSGEGPGGGYGGSAEVCYQTADGTPALTGSSEAWFVPWQVWRTGTSPRVEYPPASFGRMGGEAPALVFLGDSSTESWGAWCVTVAYRWEYGAPGSYEIAVWSKLRGFAPVVSYPATGDTPLLQVVEPISDQEDAAELCPPPTDTPLVCRISGSVVGPDGKPIAGPDWLPQALHVYPKPDAGIGPVWPVLWAGPPGVDGRFEGEAPDPSVVLLFARGYLPSIQCLPCGEHVVQVEPSPYTYSPPASGCSVTPGASGPRRASTFALLVALLALAGRPGSRRRRRRRS